MYIYILYFDGKLQTVVLGHCLEFVLMVDVSHIGFGLQEGPIRKQKNHFSLLCYNFNGKRQFICTSGSSGTRYIAFNDFS